MFLPTSIIPALLQLNTTQYERPPPITPIKPESKQSNKVLPVTPVTNGDGRYIKHFDGRVWVWVWESYIKEEDDEPDKDTDNTG